MLSSACLPHHALPSFPTRRSSDLKLDFMKLAKPAFITSWLIIAIGIAVGFHRGKSAYGRDFIGGDSVTFSFQQKIDPDKLRPALTRSEEHTSELQSPVHLGCFLLRASPTTPYPLSLHDALPISNWIS